MITFFRAIILFLIIFNFKMPYIRYSAALSVILATLYYIFQWQEIPYKQFLKYYSIYILMFLIGLCIYSQMLPILYLTFDFGVRNGFAVQLFLLLCILYVFPCLKANTDNAFNQISEIVIVAYCIQAVILLASFLNSAFGDLILSFREDQILEDMKRMDQTFRIGSLAGNPLFELPAGCGVAFILYFYLQFSNSYSGFISKGGKYIILTLLATCAMLTGRTAWTGLACGVVMSVFMQKPTSAKIKFAVRSILTIGVFVGLATVTLPSRQLRFMKENIVPFAFEFFYSYDDNGRVLTTASTEELRHMYFPVSNETFLKGDGRYTGAFGGYYKDTDAGYMRTILFGGIGFLLSLVFYQMLFFYSPMRCAWREMPNVGRNDFICLLTLLLHIFIVTYKGECLGRMQIMQSLMLLLCSAYLANEINENDENSIPTSRGALPGWGNGTGNYA